MKKCIIAVGAHADDIELRMGATLAKYIAGGYKGVYIVLTCSNSGWNYPSPEGGPGAYSHSDEISRIRCEQEAPAAAKVLGAECRILMTKESLCTDRQGRTFNLDFAEFDYIPPGRMPIVSACVLASYVDELAEIFIREEPEIVMTQPMDHNLEHGACQLWTWKSFRQARIKAELGRLFVAKPHEVGGGGALAGLVKADYYEDVTDSIEVNIKAMGMHRTQHNPSEHEAGILRRTEELGKVIGVKHAEAFCRVYWPGETRSDQLQTSLALP